MNATLDRVIISPSETPLNVINLMTTLTTPEKTTKPTNLKDIEAFAGMVTAKFGAGTADEESGLRTWKIQEGWLIKEDHGGHFGLWSMNHESGFPKRICNFDVTGPCAHKVRKWWMGYCERSSARDLQKSSLATPKSSTEEWMASGTVPYSADLSNQPYA